MTWHTLLVYVFLFLSFLRLFTFTLPLTGSELCMNIHGIYI